MIFVHDEHVHPLEYPVVPTLYVTKTTGPSYCSYVEGHAVIVAMQPGCLLSMEGVEEGDILDELCGEQVQEDMHGKVSWSDSLAFLSY